jgi:hypothetical protein
MFERVEMPEAIPNDLRGLREVQEKWLRPCTKQDRPHYIGSWNSVALFMAAMFQNGLWRKLSDLQVILPIGGAIYGSLLQLSRDHVLLRRPARDDRLDEKFELGAITNNNGLMLELLARHHDRCTMDVHSGLYQLGTRQNWSGKRRVRHKSHRTIL